MVFIATSLDLFSVSCKKIELTLFYLMYDIVLLFLNRLYSVHPLHKMVCEFIRTYTEEHMIILNCMARLSCLQCTLMLICIMGMYIISMMQILLLSII